MSKQKTKRVCVGWGIWDIVDKCLWVNPVGMVRWWTRKEAIEAFDYLYEDGSYEWNRQRGLVIATKIRVEVK